MADDYDLTELQQISVRGLRFNIMPRYLYHYNDKDYEKFSLDLLDLLVKQGGVAIDIGAHYGIYSLLAAQKSRTVYAFEPVPENYEILKKNVQDNNLENIVVPINKATSDRSGNIEFNVTWASDSAGFYEHPNAEVIRKIKVETNSIDNELQDVTGISFIKIDTEGHEIHVLEGLRHTLKNNKDAKMLIEFNPECLVNAGASSAQLIHKIISLDYDIFAVYEDRRYMMRVEANTPEIDILQGQKYLNLLCLPKGSWQNMLFISHSADFGGAERVLLETVSDIIARDDKFVIPFVVLPGDGMLSAKLSKLPIPLKVLAMRGWTDNAHLKPAKASTVKIVNSNAIAELTKIVVDFKPGVICTNTLAVPWGALVAKACNIPHIWSIHEFGDLDHGLQFDYGYEQSLHYVDALSNKVIVNSQAVKKHLGKVIPLSKLTIMQPNTVKPRLSAKLQPTTFKANTELRLVITGRVAESKGQFDAVKALEAVREQGHKAELLIVGQIGSKAYHAEITAYCKQHKLEDYVHFVGFQDNPFDYVDMANIALVCSRSEAFGLVTIEAMMLGKVVVGADSGATPENIQDGITGLLYEPGNSQDLARKIISLKDEKRRHKLAEAGQIYAEKHFPNAYSDAIYQLLVQVYRDWPPPSSEFDLFKDVLDGMYLQMAKSQQETAERVTAHAQELKNFSDEYNKVYAAYDETSKRLSSLENNKILKTSRKFIQAKSRIGKLKGRRK